MITHNGFTFRCSINQYNADGCDSFIASVAHTHRTAVKHAREAGWAIVRLRLTAGAPANARAINLDICPHCKWLLGL